MLKWFEGRHHWHNFAGKIRGHAHRSSFKPDEGYIGVYWKKLFHLFDTTFLEIEGKLRNMWRIAQLPRKEQVDEWDQIGTVKMLYRRLGPFITDYINIYYFMIL